MSQGVAAPPRRIALIHALGASVAPIHAAFARHWPQAVRFDLLDTSLAGDLQQAGRLTASLIERFEALARYAQSAGGEGGHTAGIMFTCSAFGPAIEAARRAVTIPVLKPNEAAFEAALQAGRRIGLLVSFAPSLPALQSELQELAGRHGKPIEITARIVTGALDALKRGDVAEHDRQIAAAAASMPPIDCLILGQFSMARAASVIVATDRCPLITTPDSAVTRLRTMLMA